MGAACPHFWLRITCIMLILDKISFYGERPLKNFESTKKLAISGDVDAQYNLGLMYS